MDPTRLALEANLRDSPDDTTAHAAYADYLAECGDPRGDYIRLQLALEDRDQPPGTLREMEQAAFALRQRHERDWLGPLYPFAHPDRTGLSVAEPVGPRVDVQYRFGWLHRVEIRGLTPEIAAALAACPLAGMLSELDVRPVEGSGEHTPRAALAPWAAAPFAGSLRKLTVTGLSDQPGSNGAFPESNPLHELLQRSNRLFHLDLRGDELDGDGVVWSMNEQLIALCLTAYDLHFTQVSGFGGPSFPNLASLILNVAGSLHVTSAPSHLFTGAGAAAPAMRYLAVHTPDIDDDALGLLIASGIVDRLAGLDLQRCRITDDGARMLAAHPAVPRLEYLRLADNYLSPVGIADLAAVGVTVSGSQNFGPPPAYDVDGDPDAD